MKRLIKRISKKENGGALFIPAGLLLGMGIGYLLKQVHAGLLIGLGIGMAAFGVSILYKK